MRKIIQIVTGMYTKIDIENDFDAQKYAIIVLCDDNTIWEFKEDEGWKNIETESITDYIKPKKK